MANTRKTCGLQPINITSDKVHFYKAVTGAAYYRGTPVSLNASGYVEWAGMSVGTGGVTIVGSIVGFLDGKWAPGSEAQSGYISANPDGVDANGYINVAVADDPSQLFLIEEDTGGSALTVASNFLGGVMTVLATSGNTVSGVANVVLDRSNCATAPSSNMTLQLIKKWDKEDNDYGNYCKWIVRINDHSYNRAQATSGLI